MKKKISFLLSVFALALMTVPALADPCVVSSTHGESGTWREGSCYGSSGGCQANICTNEIE